MKIQQIQKNMLQNNFAIVALSPTFADEIADENSTPILKFAKTKILTH